MVKTSTRSLLESLDARIAERAARRSIDISRERWAFRLAAAVLTSFNYAALRPVVDGDERLMDANPMVLLPDLIEAPGGREAGLYMLRTDIRRQALESLGGRARMLRALEANPKRSQDGFQKMFEAWQRGDAPSLKSQNYTELTWTAQIGSWLEGLLPDIPPLTEINRVLNRRSVYALFEHLATSTFTGRESELALLREHVGVLEPSARTDAVVRQLRSWLGITRKAPLVIEGIGGVGKSALLARFLTEHMHQEAAQQFPFAYLAFDSPTLKAEEPFTLIAEIFRQLRLLYPEPTPLFEDFNRAFEEYRNRRGALDERSNVKGGRRVRSAQLHDTEFGLYDHFAYLVNKLSERHGPDGVQFVPFLLVLDTFEEASFGGAERLIGFFEWLGALHKQCPRLRIVISMRPPALVKLPSALGKPADLHLSDLEPAAGALLLERLGVADAEVAKTIVRQIGGNPLNLTLAGRLLQKETAGSQGFDDLKTSSWFFFSVSDEVIRGQLYSRLLNHIHDKDVRRLAHPGMVLRRVTPEIILEVLSGPCGVSVKDISRADELFRALAKEHTLVQLAPGDRELSYRPDIRQPTLRLLQQERPQEVRAIHEAAVAYYGRRGKTSDKIELLYHLLAKDSEAWELDDHWQKAAVSLAPALDELPARAQAWLAAKLGRPLSEEMRLRATLEDWERSVASMARFALQHLEAERALSLMSERSDRSAASPLFALEAKAHVLMEDYSRAEEILGRGIDSISAGANRGRLAELLWLLAQVLETQERVLEADEILSRAERVTDGIADPLSRLQVLTQRLLLRRNISKELSDPAGPIRERLALVCSGLSDATMDRERTLVRTAIMLLGASYTAPFVAGLRVVGCGEVTAGQRETLAGDLFEWLERNPSETSSFQARVAELQEGQVDLESVLPSLLEARSAWPVLLPALETILEAQSHSLEAANLAGLDAYREAWEFELTAEAA